MVATDTCRSCMQETTGPVYRDDLGPHLVCEHCGASFNTDVVQPSYRYYTIYRPPAPGTVPPGFIRQRTYGSRPYMPDVGHSIWGEVDYNRPLTAVEISDYELAPAASVQYPIDSTVCEN